MYNVILIKKDGTELYVGSDGTLVNSYTKERALRYEFDDYEDAHNVELDFMENAQDMYGYEIEVIQM